MKKIILICGKICSGKSHYARLLQEKENAVILSTDEATFDLIENQQGEFYNMFSTKVKHYLRKKAVEIARAGTTVILDWGFWSSDDRKNISDYLKAQEIFYEWHYMDVSNSQWHKNIQERNSRIRAGNGGSDFYVDEGLMRKLLCVFETPSMDEMDIWYKPTE